MSAAVRRVLYIDDDAGLRRLVERALARRGYEVDRAATATRAWRLLARRRLRRRSRSTTTCRARTGFEPCASLRDAARAPPIVYVTGSDESRVAVAALKAGAADYVVKAVGDEFFDLLDSAFSQAPASGAAARAKTAEAEEALRGSQRAAPGAAARGQPPCRQQPAARRRLRAPCRRPRSATTRRARRCDDTQRRIAGDRPGPSPALHVRRRADASRWTTYLACPASTSWRRVVDTGCAAQHAADRRAYRLAYRQGASALGVIVNELVTNACKYAYGPTDRGENRVDFAHAGAKQFRLSVEDDGPGLQPGSEPVGTGLGSKLIAAMAKALATTVQYDTTHAGVRAVVTAAI